MAQATAARDGRQARWERHNRERRLHILRAALVVLESSAPGTEFHVQQIAAQAELNRTVVYRHFTDRADLDRAVRTHILDGLAAELLPHITLDGTVSQIIRRVVSTYVDWVVAHPSLHRFADQEGAGPMQHGIARIATVLVQLLEAAIDLLDVELSDGDRASVDPLAHGLVGAVVGAVRPWIAREERVPTAAQLSELLSESVWFILDGHARRLGLEIDPDKPLADLVG
jgi:AcrR family transcriptional regulator